MSFRLVTSVLTMAAIGISSGAAHAQTRLRDGEDRLARLSQVDLQFMESRLARYDLNTLCTAVGNSVEEPRNDFRKLTFQQGEQEVNLLVQPDVLRSDFVFFYVKTPGEAGFRTYSRCRTADILPVLALVSTSVVGENENIVTVSTRQEVMAQHSFLTSHEPNRLMVRSDDNDVSDYYMDFTVSAKHPLFPNSSLLNSVYQATANGIDNLTGRENGLFIQPYLSFTGRFSQYLNSRESSPVVARRYNPSLFLRAWSSRNSYLDLGFAHESNGQNIDSIDEFERQVQSFVENGESESDARAFARDDISRGWDYSFVEWRKGWHQRFATRVQLRHYHRGGPLQHGAEEYNWWEGDGEQYRPRRQFDGVLMALEYDFGRNRCLEGVSFVCFQKMSVTQETGYSQVFENNTTTLEFTSNLFGLPIQLWGRTGYGSDLVDYYNYSTSWGIGVELISH